MSDLRSDLENAFKEVESASTGDGSSGSVGALHESEPMAAESAPATTGSALENNDASSGTEARSATQRARDASGKFAKAQAPKETQVAAKQGSPDAPPARDAGENPHSPGATALPAAPQTPAAPPTQTVRAPQSWTPAEREHFAKAPPEVQAAIARVDREVRQVMQEAAPARRFQQEFQQAVTPYVPLLRAEGVEPMQAVQATLGLLAVMRTGTPRQKAETVANFVRQYGVDVPELDSVLSTAPQQQPQTVHARPQEFRDPRLDELLTHLQTQRDTKWQREVEAFTADPANEFFEDVRLEMAGFIDAARARGVEMSLKDAYTRAVWANPEIRAILQQKEAAKAAVTAQATTQRNLAAGSSIRNSPATPVNGASGGSLRADIEAAAALVGGR